jgi:hypothetical protein
MGSPRSNKKTLIIRIDEELYYKLMELHISPTSVTKTALKAAVRQVLERQRLEERRAGLHAVQSVDPRVTDKELRSSSPRVRRLRRIASVQEPSIGV